MKPLTSLVLTSVMVGITFATFDVFDADDMAGRKLVAMMAHLESRGSLQWEDHEVGDGTKVAVYSDDDWLQAEQHLHEFGHTNYTWTPPDVPAAQATVMPPATTEHPALPVTTQGPVRRQASVTTTLPRSGTTAIEAAGTRWVSRWQCEAPYNVPVVLGESAFLAWMCRYITPWFYNRIRAFIRRTIILPSQRALGPLGPVIAHVVVHMEANAIFPALDTIGCVGGFASIITLGYCWGYGKNFQLSRFMVKRDMPQPDSTVGGIVYLHPEDSDEWALRLRVVTIGPDYKFPEDI